MGQAEVDLPHLADAGLARPRPRQQSDGNRLPLLYPAGGPYYPGNGIVPAIPGTPLTGDLDLFWRALETGPRTNQVKTDEYRILVGASGLAWGWDYNVGTYYVSSEVTETYLAGYLLESKLLPAMYTGVINPFGYQTAAGMAALNVDADHRRRAQRQDHRVGRRRRGREADHATLPTGPLSLAVGFQYQNQKYSDNPSAILSTGGHHRRRWRTAAGCGRPRFFSLFGELSIPIMKNLDAQVAVRWDDYSDFGSNVSPKFGIRWQPSSALLIRGSYGQGFQAPTIPDTGVAAGPQQLGRFV